MDGQLKITTLGSLDVERGSEPITAFESNKVRALLVYLAVESERPHRRECLAGLLWPDFPERSARVNLRGALANLRSAIGDREATPSFLHITRQTVQFNIASDVWVDVAAFNALLARTDAGRPDVAQLEEAVKLYAGSFLEGFSIPDSPAFEEWALLERERLQRLFAEALVQLADHYREGGAHDVALRHARRLLALDPLMEAAHRQVMVCLARSGQRSAALAQYEACRQTLSNELGAEPEAETAALYDEILAGQLAAPTQVRAEPAHNLPLQLTPFVGRKGELAELERLLVNPDVRLLTVIGPGGTGKTRLALQAAADILSKAGRDAFEHGVFFVPLAPLRSAKGIVPALAEALDFTFYEGGERQGQSSLEEQLLAYLRRRRLLLIMDNYEHLLSPPLGGMPAGQGGNGSAELITKILTNAPGVKILTTSRARLNVRGENLFPLAGMAFPALTPDREEFEDAGNFSAIQLFLQSARRVRPGFDLTAANATAIVRTCRLLHGLPLGVLLAAAWVEILNPDEVADQIAGSIDFLETDEGDVPERQRSMRATFDHSWQLLSPRQRDIMKALSVFRGSFTWGAAQAVAGASLRELRTLVNRSLLLRGSGPSAALGGDTGGRFELHELLRQYAEEKLAASPGASAAAHERHCAHYAAALERLGVDIKGARQGAALAEMRVDRENARAAWDWAVEQQHVARLSQAVEGLGRYHERRGRWQAGETACRIAAETLSGMGKQAASDQMEKTAANERLWVLGKILTWQGTFSYYLARLEAAGQLLRQGLDLLEEQAVAGTDTRADRAWALHMLSAVARDSGDNAEDARLKEQSLRLYRAAGDRWGTAILTASAANSAQGSGDYDEAKRLAEESQALRRAIGDHWGTANALTVLGRIALFQTEFEQAEYLFREAIAVRQEIGHRGWESFADLTHLSAVLAWSGKFADAHTVAQENRARVEDLGQSSSPIASWAQLDLAEAKRHLGRYAEARAHCQMGLDLNRESDSRAIDRWFLSELGAVALASDAYVEAHKLFQQSGVRFQEFGGVSVNYGLVLTLTYSAYAARGAGKVVEAREYLCQALQRAIDFNNALGLIQALPPAALILADAGVPARKSAQSGTERAVELYALASRYAHVANSRWYEDVAGKHIAAIAATLPPDVVAAAQERGKTRDLWETAAELLQELKHPDVG